MNPFAAELLKREKQGVYGIVQCQFSYHSNRMNGNTLKEDQVNSIFHQGILPPSKEEYPIKAIQEVTGHFLMFENMLKTYQEPLSLAHLQKYHQVFRNGIIEEQIAGDESSTFRVGTEEPMQKLLSWYQNQEVTLEVLAELSVNLHKIWPFQNGSSSLISMILFKEALRADLVPFIIHEENQFAYLRSQELTNPVETLSLIFAEEQKQYEQEIQPSPVANIMLMSMPPVEKSRSMFHSEDDFKYQSEGYFHKTTTPGFYNYCPSVFQKNDVTYLYFCTNTVPYQIEDSIGLVKSLKDEKIGNYLYTDTQIVLSSGENGSWDSMHVCDPSVIEGRFLYEGKEYQYLMGYLGCTSIDNQDNQNGVAVSNDLMKWIKIKNNPLVQFIHDIAHKEHQWGVGQISMINLDKKGTIAMFYTSGTYNLTSEKLCIWNISNLDQPVILKEYTVSNAGTKRLDDYPDFISNADFAYRNGILYMVCDTHPYGLDTYENGVLVRRDDSITPDRSSVYCMKVDLLAAEIRWGTWERKMVIDKKRTGYDKNHNCGFVRDSYGYLPDGEITIMYTGAKGQTDGVNPYCRLWTYEIQKTVL